MNISARSYLAAGVAMVGAGAIAMTPVQPLSAALAPQKALSQLAVDLASSVDPITNLTDAIEATGTSLNTLVNQWAQGIYVQGSFTNAANPLDRGYKTGVALPITYQFVTNLLSYIGELPDIGTIAGQVVDNIGNALSAPFQPGADVEFAGGSFNQNVNGLPYFNAGLLGDLSQRSVWSLLGVLLPENTYASLKPVLDFATSPISGLLVGALGPIVAPVLSVVNSVGAVIDALGNSDFQGALFELINAPVNAISAFLNGGPTLDLTGLVGLLGVDLPESVKSIGLKMGGLLSSGGVAFDALAAQASQPITPDISIDVNIPGLPVGPIGALAGLANYIAASITPAPAANGGGGTEAVEGIVRASAERTSVAALPAATEAAPTATEESDATPVVTADKGDSAPVKQPRRAARGAAAKAGSADNSSAAASAAKSATPKGSAARRGSR